MSDVDTEPPTATVNSGTAAGLLAFFDYLLTHNYMVGATANSWRTGCKKVLEVERDLNAIDIRTADLDDITRRFRIRVRGEMKERSIDAYEQRFRDSVDMYRKWLLSDPAWRPTTRKRITNGGGPQTRSRTNVSDPPLGSPPAHQGDTHGQMITYPIVIRPGVHGKIILPEDLTPREAKRIAALISTLALDEPVAGTDQHDS
jgi:hypothetical protein